ncbi:phospholipase A2 inhibitor and Ly6/PLAUR domain-containing protein-like [Hyperolius riggenbachi]|uniref:phospholipase A2 inhibitor and Ly6/PLAUR domain-containing protein-like n=1 Tax=Hyperolius riggenbachi TaxID=752182 RepID=UPI0035A274DA
MKGVLASLLIVLMVSTTGECLVCQQCANYTGSDCSSYTSQTCDKTVTQCVSLLMVQKLENKTLYQTWKSCADDPLMCYSTYNMSSGVYIYSKAECCEGDLCNSEPIQLNETSTEDNGVECPVCHAKSACCTSEPGETMKCQGPQTQCVIFIGKVYNGTHFNKWTHHGCITESACQYQITAYPASLIDPGYILTCLQPKH